MRRFPAPLAVGAAAFALLSSAVGQTSPTASADTAFHAGDFATAERGYEAVLKSSPKDAAALAGLARIRVLENRNDQAIALAREALAVDPANASAGTTVRGAELRKADLAGAGFHLAAPPSAETVIPFVATDPLPIVQVTIGGRRAYFFIDTGAADFIIRPELAKELGLQTEAAGQGVFAGGKRAALERTTIPELQIGGIRITNARAMVLG